MFQRKVLEELIKWKNDINKKPLLIKGCRQIGKTYIVKYFGQNYYEDFVYIDFMAEAQIKSLFLEDLDVDKIINQISYLKKKKITEQTLIIFDEIQECEKARTFLKYLALDNRYDCIATGSLLGIKNYSPNPSPVPVGYEETIIMKAMDFEEFCMALNEYELFLIMKDHYINKIKIDNIYLNNFNNLFKLYLLIGGMPAAIDVYIKHKDLNDVFKIQKNIINDYKDDVIKYAPNTMKNKIVDVFNSIPNQLAKENKKFQYGIIKKGSKASYYDGAIEWLIDAGIVVKSCNLSTLKLPLSAYKDTSNFKIYMADVGLLIPFLDDNNKDNIYFDNFDIYKGAIIENYLADVLYKKGYQLYFYKPTQELEIDFIYTIDSNIIPIECKTSNNKSKSLSTLLYKYDFDLKYGIKLINGNIGIKDKIISIPLSFAIFL